MRLIHVRTFRRRFGNSKKEIAHCCACTQFYKSEYFFALAIFSFCGNVDFSMNPTHWFVNETPCPVRRLSEN